MSACDDGIDLETFEDRPLGYAPQCVSCSQFVKVADPATVRHYERGDYGTIYSVEFECGRCAMSAREDKARRAM